MKQIYFAGPCFSSAERMWNVMVVKEVRELCRRAKLNIDFFLPQDKIDESWERLKIYDTLTNGLYTSEILIANLDGPGGDDGTCWEMGYVAGMNGMVKSLTHEPEELKQIYWYRTDFRNGGDSAYNVNLMMAYGGTPLVLHGKTNPIGVASAIYKIIRL